MLSPRRDAATAVPIPPGVALMPEDFCRRLDATKEMTGLSWEGMASVMGVDSRQLWRWRKRGGEPGGGAMLALVRLVLRVPGGLAVLMDEDVMVIHELGR